MDSLLFAYRKNRSIDDAMLRILNNIYSHLEKPGTCIRLMLYDFSSAFNTIQPHLLSEKLLNMNVHASTITWILDYLTNRPQYVKVLSGRKSCSHQQTLASEQNVISDVIWTNIVTSQGTVFSPFLFSLYTADCRSSHDDCIITKYDDDTVLTGQITNILIITTTSDRRLTSLFRPELRGIEHLMNGRWSMG